MPGQVISVSSPDIAGRLRLTVREEHFEGDTRRTYRLSEEDYEALGAPVPGAALTDEELDFLRECEGKIGATAKAVELLSYGDNSANGLCRKLRNHGYTRQAAEDAVARMIGKGYLNEPEQARHYAVTAANRKHWGRRRIAAGLAAKGYNLTTVFAAIDAAEQDGEIDFRALAAELVQETLGENPEPTERRKLLQKYGF